MSTRFGRQPYIPPEDDPSIREIEDDRHYQVGRIYNAMTRGDRARDNTNSIAMKRWVNAAHYKSDLVEAFSHKLFDCLLVQVKEGFRGWHHNDYVDDDRKGEKEDRDADCMSRLENIIDALEREKTICEDVVNSASQIRISDKQAVLHNTAHATVRIQPDVDLPNFETAAPYARNFEASRAY
ncbi:hypothetical protein N0V95_003029 [Ascochyta clinopodiicola]|nr:hypothetical protein N0V95_003029 [Ascochyta clinopodiicola]